MAKFPVQVALVFGGALLCCFVYAAAPTLSGTVTNAGTILRLELHGSTGTNYTIESSSDLKGSSPFTNGPAVNGLFVTLLSIDPALAKRFFRGREPSSTAAAFPANVVLTVNTNSSLVTVVTTNGASAVLYGPDGSRFTFTVPPHRNLLENSRSLREMR